MRPELTRITGCRRRHGARGRRASPQSPRARRQPRQAPTSRRRDNASLINAARRDRRVRPLRRHQPDPHSCCDQAAGQHLPQGLGQGSECRATVVGGRPRRRVVRERVSSPKPRGTAWSPSPPYRSLPEPRAKTVPPCRVNARPTAIAAWRPGRAETFPDVARDPQSCTTHTVRPTWRSPCRLTRAAAGPFSSARSVPRAVLDAVAEPHADDP